MSEALIYQPAKSAMQSGRLLSKIWILEFQSFDPQTKDRLMGWYSSSDTKSQIRLHFHSKEEAIYFAKQNGLSYTFINPLERRVRPKNYAENFLYRK